MEAVPAAKRNRNKITIEKVRTGASEEVERLWYSIYVEELGYQPAGVDHDARRVHEPFAKEGSLHVATDGSGQVVGTVLSVHGASADFASYRELYGVEGSLEGVAFTTRLVVTPGHRRRRLTLDLAIATYVDAWKSGVKVAHIDVQARNVALFERLGYKQRGFVDHPLYGSSVHMTLDLWDVEHLANVRSPLLSHAPPQPDRFRSKNSSPRPTCRRACPNFHRSSAGVRAACA